MKESSTHLFFIKYIAYLLITIQLGLGSVSLAYLLLDNDQNLVEYCNSIENKSIMDENEEEVDDMFKLVFDKDNKSLKSCVELRYYSDSSQNNEHIEICTPPPKRS